MLSFDKYVHTIDTHTMGEPTRILVGNLPLILGNTMVEKKEYMQRHYQSLRQWLINEPRGHRDMFGAVITEPSVPGCDMGLIFMNSEDYQDACGHGTIGAVTAAIQTGKIPPKDVLYIDTPVGNVTCHIHYQNGKVKYVSFQNVVSFTLMEHLLVKVDGVGEVPVDISFGGNFFGIVDARHLGFCLEPEEQTEIIEMGIKIKNAVNKQISVKHPENYEINMVSLIEFSLPLEGANHYRNAVVFGKGQLDRSPCGTGTCAKMAMLYKQGKLSINEEFVHESILNSKFKGKIIGTKQVGLYSGIIPEITGSAYITGMHQFFLDEDDPYPNGFSL